MKVPLEQEPFPPVQLNREQELQLEWLSDVLLDETLTEYLDYVHNKRRILDKKLWKETMTRENVTTFKRIGEGDLGGITPDVTLHQSNPAPSTLTWRMPRILGVGTLPGQIEDVVYGMQALTKRETDIRTTYVKDEVGDGRVLATVIRPTALDPLRSMIVRWQLVYQFIHKYVVTPRDVVNMESLGIHELPNGDRYGYALLQSVDVPGCEELVDYGFIRCKFATCFVFKDTGSGSVELYMRGFVEPGGNIPVNLAVASASMSFISIWRIMMCGQNKKLAWMVRNHNSSSQSILGETNMDGDGRSCTICHRSVSSFRSPVKCDICGGKVCHKCADKRKLTHVRSTGQFVRVTTRICKTCIIAAVKTPTSHVAMTEQVPLSSRIQSTNSSSSSISSQSSRPKQSPDFGAMRYNHARPVLEKQQLHSIPFEDVGYDSDGSALSFNEEPFSIGSPAYARSSVPDVASVSEEPPTNNAQMHLWLRMNKLRVAAEEAFILTQQNAHAMKEVQAGIAPRLRSESTTRSS